MSSLVVVILLSLGLALVTTLFIVRSRQKHPNLASLCSEVNLELEALRAHNVVAKRIFANEDLAFISSTNSVAVREAFLIERKRLALLWLRSTRRQVKKLLSARLVIASHTESPDLGSEVELVLQHVQFLVLSLLASFVIWLRGPFASPLLAGWTLRFFSNLSDAPANVTRL
jgi:hypothetical protein